VLANAVQSCTENMSAIRYVIPVTNAMVRVIAAFTRLDRIGTERRRFGIPTAIGAFLDGFWHLFSDVAIRHQDRKAVQRIHQTCDEANNIILPNQSH